MNYVELRCLVDKHCRDTRVVFGTAAMSGKGLFVIIFND